MPSTERKYAFTAAASRKDKTVTLVLSGYIWPDSNNASALVAERLSMLEDGDQLNVLIRNLYGGDTDEGMTIYHDLRAYKPSVKVDGVVASMGTVIMCAGKDIEVSGHSKGMTHRPTGAAIGDFEDMRARADQNEAVYKEMADIYAQRTGMSAEEAMTKLMPRSKDVWLTAGKMKELGLCDKVTTGSLLRTVALRDLRSIEQPEELIARFAAAMDPEQEPETKIKDNAMSKELAKKLGLPETASEADIAAAIDKLQSDNATATGRVDALEKAEKERVAKELDDLLEAATKDNRMTAAVRDKVKEAAKENPTVALSMAREMIAALPQHKGVAAQLRNGDAATQAKLQERAGWTYDDWFKKDPKGLQEMKQKDEAAFTKLRDEHAQRLRN